MYKSYATAVVGGGSRNKMCTLQSHYHWTTYFVSHWGCVERGVVVVLLTKIAVNRWSNNVGFAVFIAAHDKVIDSKLANGGTHLADQVALLPLRHVLAHVLAVEPPHVMELGGHKERILLTTADLRSNLGQTFIRTLVTLLRHVVHPDRGWVGGGDIQVRLVHVQIHCGGHVGVKVLRYVTTRAELGL